MFSPRAAPAVECHPVLSKDQFQRELDFPVGGRRRIKRARATNRRSVLIEERTVGEGRVKVRMIEYIEKFCADLQVQVLLDFSILDQGKIKVHHARPVDLIATTVAEEVLAGARCR